MRAVVVGANWGLVHVYALRQAGVEVVALGGRDRHQLANVAALHGIAHIVDSAAEIRALAPDLVTLATPAASHGDWLRELADRDPLTGLYNRRPFDQRVNQELTEVVPFALLMLDIDFFKRYNDRYGHLAGDRALMAVAEVLQAELQEQELVSRFGGEEFSLLLRVTDPQLLRQRICAILVRVAQLRLLHEDAPLGWLSVSIGAVLWQLEPGLSCAHLLHRADEALYLAKRNGRCCGYLGNLQILPLGEPITLADYLAGKK